MLPTAILFLAIGIVAGSLCLADLSVPAASAVRSLTASCLAFSAIIAIAWRATSLDARDGRKPEGG